jgi:hypothetical protein
MAVADPGSSEGGNTFGWGNGTLGKRAIRATDETLEKVRASFAKITVG